MPDSDRPLNGLSHSDKIATGPSVHMCVQTALAQTNITSSFSFKSFIHMFYQTRGCVLKRYSLDQSKVFLSPITPVTGNLTETGFGSVSGEVAFQ